MEGSGVILKGAQAGRSGLRGRVLSVTGRDEVALVYLAELREDRRSRVEFVDALDPRYPRDQKWVVIVSTQFGCPVGCLLCDAGGWFDGNLGEEEILWQADHVVYNRFPDGRIPSAKFKVQFARMGEPALNPAVLGALRTLRTRYEAPGLIPCVATIAPAAAAAWFEELAALKSELYNKGAFQLQFSVNTTDEALRDRLMPARKWGLREIAAYGARFFEGGDRKVALNFALGEGFPLDTAAIAGIFDPARFLVKLTPVNPTEAARGSGIASVLAPRRPEACAKLVRDLRARGFEVIVSIGTEEEIAIRSNCGQAVLARSNGGQAGPRTPPSTGMDLSRSSAR